MFGRQLIAQDDFGLANHATGSLASTVSLSASPTSGDDNLVGTSGSDTIDGLAGNDRIDGLAGNDQLYGSDGDDTIGGGAGSDIIGGGNGADLLFSGSISPAWTMPYAGNPYIAPVLDRGSEVDTLTGGPGDDRIFAGYGDNVDGGSQGYLGDKLFISFQGAPQGITFDAHLATQVIGGGTIAGIENVSWVEGSNYADHIDLGSPFANGYSDFTAVFGMGGDDTIIGGTYTGLIDGGDGNDLIDARASSYLFEADGGSGDDTIYTDADAFQTANGGDGNDTIYAGYDIHGGAGNDVIHIVDSQYQAIATGDDGDDKIYGSSHGDYVDGGDGGDLLDGGGGNDTLLGGSGDDVLTGGAGDDLLSGGAGNDVLTGGDGRDLFDVGEGNDLITDFCLGDNLKIRASFSAGDIRQAGSDVVITFSGQNQLTLQNTSVATVTTALQSGLQTNDVATSPDGSTEFVAGDDGTLYVYNARTGDFLNAWHVGNELGGLDVSPDGTFAIATELQPLSSFIDPNDWTKDHFTAAVYKIDLRTGQVTTYSTELTGVEYAFYDAAIMANGQVLLTEQAQPYWSSSLPLRTLDLSTGKFASAYAYGGMGSYLTAGADHSTVLVGVANSSDAPLDIYTAGTGVTAFHGDYDDGVEGYNFGIQAYSQQGGLVAQNHGTQIDIYSNTLQFKVELSQALPQISAGGVGGLAFDASGKFLFVLNVQDDVIYKISTSDWTITAGYAVGADISSTSSNFGNSLLIAPDSSYFLVLTDHGTVKVDPTAQLMPATDGPDTLIGGAGNDMFDGLGGNDMISGMSGDDTLHGGAGDDTISGGAGADIIDGGDGNDTLYAGDAMQMDGINEHDIITGGIGDDLIFAGYGDDVDGGTGIDKLHLSFAGATSGVTFNTGDLVAGASIGGGTIRNIEYLVELQGSASGDSITISNNVAYGAAFNAGGGDDTIQSLAQQITINGDGGNDSITARGDYSTVNGGSGNDTILLSANYSNADGGDGDDIINVSGEDNAILGGAGNDLITFSGTYGSIDAGDGNDHIVILSPGTVVNGGAGDDVFVSSGANNWLSGGAGSDMVDYSGASAGVSVDLSVGTGAGGDQLDGIENITGSAFGDVLTGDANANVLRGGDGDDILGGGAGADTLSGGAGNDIFLYKGGDGSDTITDFAAGDTVSFTGYGYAQSITQVGADVLLSLSGSDQIIFQNSSVAIVQAGLHFDPQAIQPPMNLVGTPGNDTLIGGSGNDTLSGGAGDDVLDGRQGSDRMTGGTGNDIYYVDSAGDVIIEQSRQGTDTVHSTISITLPDNVENGILDGSAFLSLTGNALDNVLQGNSGDNLLNGGSGNDSLSGGDGNDTLRGGTGSDTLTGGAGADIFQFETGSGNDQITDFQTGVDKLDFHLLGISAASVTSSLSHGSIVLKVDANHDGHADFSITLAGVSHIEQTTDFIF